MYDAFPFIMGAVIILMGIFMVVCPKQATKKSMRDDNWSDAYCYIQHIINSFNIIM